MQPMQKTLVYLGLVFVALASWIVGLGCWPFLRWSPLNCSHEDIDINCGRIRRQSFLVGHCVRESVEMSSLTRALSEDAADAPPAWRRVNTFSPMVRYSPHYRYHSALWQIRHIELFWQLAIFTPEAKAQVARDVLSLWQWGKGDDPVNDYIHQLDSTIGDGGEKSTIDTKDLPSIEGIKQGRNRGQPRLEKPLRATPPAVRTRPRHEPLICRFQPQTS